KEYGSPMFPHLEFLGWTSEEAIQLFINRIKDQIPDEGSKQRINHLIPHEAVSMMYKRLTGRFRPCVAMIFSKVLLLFLVLLGVFVDAVRYEQAIRSAIFGIKEENVSYILMRGFNMTGDLAQIAKKATTLHTWAMSEEIDQGSSIIPIHVMYNPVNLAYLGYLTGTVVWGAAMYLRDWILELLPSTDPRGLRETYGIEIWSDDGCIIGLVEFKMEFISLSSSPETSSTSIPSNSNSMTTSVTSSRTSTRSKAPSQTSNTKSATKPQPGTSVTKGTTKPQPKPSKSTSSTKPQPQTSKVTSTPKPQSKKSPTKSRTNTTPKISLTKTVTKRISRTSKTKSATNPSLQPTMTASGGMPPLVK
ncbi:hypothetical protein BGZ76_005144, partial [Entomortierella beljakovae]